MKLEVWFLGLCFFCFFIFQVKLNFPPNSKSVVIYEAHTDEIMVSHHYSDNSYNFDRPGRVDYYIVEEKYKDSVLAETMNKGWWRIAFTKEACYNK